MSWLASRSSRADADALLDYWDAVIAQRPAIPIPPPAMPEEGALIRTLASTVSVTSATPDDADSLLPLLLARQREMTGMTASSATATPLPVRPDSRRARRSRPIAGWVRRQAMPAIEIAAIATLLLATVAGLWISGNDRDARILVPAITAWDEDASPPNVPMYRASPGRTGVMPGPAIDGVPAIRWQVPTDGHIVGAPALVDGVLYIGVGNAGLVAFDAANGDRLWAYDPGGPVMSSPAVAAGMVVVTRGDGRMVALDATTGAERWSFAIARREANPLIHNGVVFVEAAGRYLAALDVATGNAVWTAELPAPASRSAALGDGNVYVTTIDGVVHALDAVTGDVAWTWASNVRAEIYGMPVVANGLVYVGAANPIAPTQAGFLAALDTATGEPVWRIDAAPGAGYSIPAVGPELIHVVTGEDGMVQALDARTGESRWSSVVGAEVWGAPGVADGMLFVGTSTGDLIALDATDGTHLWTLRLDGPIHTAPIVSGGMAYLGTAAGSLYAIGGQGSARAEATPAG